MWSLWYWGAKAELLEGLLIHRAAVPLSLSVHAMEHFFPSFFFLLITYVLSLPQFTSTLGVTSLHITPARVFSGQRLIQSWVFAMEGLLILAPFCSLDCPVRCTFRKCCRRKAKQRTLEAPRDSLSLSARAASLPENRIHR